MFVYRVHDSINESIMYVCEEMDDGPMRCMGWLVGLLGCLAIVDCTIVPLYSFSGQRLDYFSLLNCTQYRKCCCTV